MSEEGNSSPDIENTEQTTLQPDSIAPDRPQIKVTVKNTFLNVCLQGEESPEDIYSKSAPAEYYAPEFGLTPESPPVPFPAHIKKKVHIKETPGINKHQTPQNKSNRNNTNNAPPSSSSNSSNEEQHLPPPPPSSSSQPNEPLPKQTIDGTDLDEKEEETHQNSEYADQVSAELKKLLGVNQPQYPPSATRQTHSDQFGQNQVAEEFQLRLDDILSGKERRTTLMVKNIPNKYSQKMLLESLDKHRGNFDFFYLPIDFKNKCNVGYAFINFIRPEYIAPFHQEFDGQTWEKFNSQKVCSISFARIQGKQAMVTHFSNSRLLAEDKKCRPLIFQSDGWKAGEEEEFPVGPNFPYIRQGSFRPRGMNDERGGQRFDRGSKPGPRGGYQGQGSHPHHHAHHHGNGTAGTAGTTGQATAPATAYPGWRKRGEAKK